MTTYIFTSGATSVNRGYPTMIDALTQGSGDLLVEFKGRAQVSAQTVAEKLLAFCHWCVAQTKNLRYVPPVMAYYLNNEENYGDANGIAWAAAWVIARRSAKSAYDYHDMKPSEASWSAEWAKARAAQNEKLIELLG